MLINRNIVFQNKAAYNVSDIKYISADDAKDIQMVDSYKKNEFGNDIFAPYNAYGSKNNSIPYGEQNSSPFLKLIPNNEQANAMSQQTEIFNFPAQKTNYFDTNFPLCDEKPRSTGTSVISYGDSEEGGLKDKKEKNRVSARECRKRKKKYIESLELEVKQLKMELKKSKELIAELRAKELQNEVAGKLQNTIPQITQTIPTKAAFEPQTRVNMRNMPVAKAMSALIDAMFDTFTKYIVWFPNDTLDSMDKKVKKPLKYISMEHKSAQE
jgi:bZIP transcription factor